MPVPIPKNKRMAYLRGRAPDNLTGVVDYFDATYVSGTSRGIPCRNGNMRMRHVPPRFPPSVWNVHEATLAGVDRTNNVCESWNNSFRHLVGHTHPSLWTVIGSLQKDNSNVETDVHKRMTGDQEPGRQGKATKKHQDQLKNLCLNVRDGTVTITRFLDRIGYFIRPAV